MVYEIILFLPCKNSKLLKLGLGFPNMKLHKQNVWNCFKKRLFNKIQCEKYHNFPTKKLGEITVFFQ